MRETKEEAGVVVEAGPVVHVSERIDREVHDLFTVFRAQLLSDGAPAPNTFDEDVSEAAWVPVERASALMPWYPGGVEALLASAGAGYSTVRE